MSEAWSRCSQPPLRPICGARLATTTAAIMPTRKTSTLPAAARRGRRDGEEEGMAGSVVFGMALG